MRKTSKLRTKKGRIGGIPPPPRDRIQPIAEEEPFLLNVTIAEDTRNMRNNRRKWFLVLIMVIGFIVTVVLITLNTDKKKKLDDKI